MVFKPLSSSTIRDLLTRIAVVGVLLLAVLYPIVRPAHAQVALATSSAGFLNFEIGAKPAGMAGAGIGIGSGVASQFWNPAFLADLNRPEVGAMHASWMGDLSYEWLGYARPMGPRWGVGSLSVAYFHMPGIQGYDQFDNPTEEFRVYDLALTAGLARPVARNVAVGANARFIRQNLADVSGNGVGLDFGLKAIVAGTTLGATVQNLGPAISIGGGSYPLPRQIRFGASREVYRDKVLLAADFNMPRDYYKDVRVGTEVRPHPIVALRLGYRQELGTSGDAQDGLSFGVGLRWKQLTVDYAMTPDNAIDDTQRLSFGYSFGAGEEKAPEPRKQPKEEKPEPPKPPTGPKVIASSRPAKSPPASTPATPSPTVASRSETPAAAAPVPMATPSAPGAPVVAPKALAEAPARAAPPKPPSKGVLYDVVLGAFQTEEGARSELKALEILGFGVKDAKVAALPGGGFRLSLARFGSRKSAENLASSLTRMSFQPRVEVVQR